MPIVFAYRLVPLVVGRTSGSLSTASGAIPGHQQFRESLRSAALFHDRLRRLHLSRLAHGSTGSISRLLKYSLTDDEIMPDERRKQDKPLIVGRTTPWNLAQTTVFSVREQYFSSLLGGTNASQKSFHKPPMCLQRDPCPLLPACPGAGVDGKGAGCFPLGKAKQPALGYEPTGERLLIDRLRVIAKEGNKGRDELNYRLCCPRFPIENRPGIHPESVCCFLIG